MVEAMFAACVVPSRSRLRPAIVRAVLSLRKDGRAYRERQRRAYSCSIAPYGLQQSNGAADDDAGAKQVKGNDAFRVR